MLWIMLHLLAAMVIDCCLLHAFNKVAATKPSIPATHSELISTCSPVTHPVVVIQGISMTAAGYMIFALAMGSSQ